MKKLTFQEVVTMIGDKSVIVYHDMWDEPKTIKPHIEPTFIGIGYVALNDEDKFCLMKDGQIRFKSLDDGDGFLKILA
jgi:hypothetical protein